VILGDLPEEVAATQSNCQYSLTNIVRLRGLASRVDSSVPKDGQRKDDIDPEV